MKSKILLILSVSILGNFILENTIQAVYGAPQGNEVSMDILAAKIDDFNRALIIKLRNFDSETDSGNRVPIKALKNLDDLSSSKGVNSSSQHILGAAGAEKNFDDFLLGLELGKDFIDQAVVNASRECDNFFLVPEILNRNSLTKIELRDTLRSTDSVKLFHVLFDLSGVSEHALGYVLKTFSQAYPGVLSESFSYLLEHVAKNPSQNFLSTLGKGLSVLGRAFYHKIFIDQKTLCSCLEDFGNSEDQFLVQALSILLSGEETRKEEEECQTFFDFSYAFCALKTFSKTVRLEELEKIEAHPQCLSMILQAWEEAIFNSQLQEQKNKENSISVLNSRSDFFSSFFSNFLEESNPNVLALALEVLLADNPNEDFDTIKANLNFVFTIFKSDIPNALPETFVRVFKILFLLDPKALGKAVGVSLNTAVDIYEACKAKNQSGFLDDKNFKDFRNILAYKIRDMLFLPKKNKLLIYFRPQEFFLFSNECDFNKGEVFFYCSKKLLNFIVDSTNDLSEDEKERIFGEMVSDSHGLDFFAKYMDLSGISFEDLSKNLQEKIHLNLLQVLSGNHWGAFLKFKDLIDKKISENEIKDDFEVYKCFSNYLKMFSALEKKENFLDKQNALNYFDETFKKDNVNFLLYLMETYNSKNYKNNIESLKYFKVKNFKNRIKNFERNKLQNLRKEEQEIDREFLTLSKKVDEFNCAKVKEIIKQDPEITEKALVRALNIDKDQKLSEKVKHFSFAYKSFLDPSSQIRTISENFEPEELLFFIERTTEFNGSMNQEFSSYLNSRYKEEQFWPSSVVSGMSFVAYNFPWLYKILMKEFSCSVQKKNHEILMLQKEKEDFILGEVTYFLVHDSFEKRENFKSSEFFNLDESEKKRKKGASIFSKKANKKFSEEYFQASTEQREQLLDDLIDFCLNVLDGEDLPYERYFKDLSSYRSFKENLRSQYQAHVYLHAASISNQDHFFPHSRLEKFFEDAFSRGKNEEKRTEKDLKASAVLTLLDINECPFRQYDHKILSLTHCNY
ncbi:hypothetical protein [Holospora undulata]|uniref:Uncharacterized protein n=1 Tax=Holospora undulata HU1 TaxID=1321371 RepID=A0A061JI63_9PROT|nr:hypothetical protein [Holospora undulata]ETZ05242.1 hypothetical protein K737_300321 [Holospora undulata HU1]